MIQNLVKFARLHSHAPLYSALRFLYRKCQSSSLGKRIASRRMYRALRDDYLYDARRYLDHAALHPHQQTETHLQAQIIMLSHCIEKGLSHSCPRLQFGQRHIDSLLRALPEYISRCGCDATTAIGMDVLTAYCQFHRQQRFPMAALESAVRELTAHGQPEVRCLGQAGGILAITRAEIHAAGKVDIESFLTSRHSIRHFDDRSVAEELIQRAVSLAISTPSVCNRQAWKARVFKDPKHKKVILDLQNGNRGFGEQIDTLIVVTCDLQSFMSVGERNEAWIDGGMFSMSLVLALHSVGLGTCCLNWSVRQEQDRELRDTIAVPEAEVIVMLIAVGHIPERLSVARSARKPLNDVLFWEP